MVDDVASPAPPGFLEPTIGQRVLARLVDIAVLLPVLLLIGALADGSVRVAAGLAVVAAYEILFVSRRGQTVGKIVMRTQIVDRSSGSVPEPGQVTVRWLVVIAGSVVVAVFPALEYLDSVYILVVLAPILRPPLHRGVHDLVAKTVVTSLARKPAQVDALDRHED